MTVHIRIWATSDAEPALVLDDLGSKFRAFDHDKVRYDVERVDVEKPIDVDIVDETVTETVTEETVDVDVHIDGDDHAEAAASA